MKEESLEFPRGEHDLSQFLHDLDEHLDFGPILVEIGSKFVSSQFYLCRMRSEFEDAVSNLGKHDEIRVSECTESEPHCKLLKD